MYILRNKHHLDIVIQKDLKVLKISSSGVLVHNQLYLILSTNQAGKDVPQANRKADSVLNPGSQIQWLP